VDVDGGGEVARRGHSLGRGREPFDGGKSGPGHCRAQPGTQGNTTEGQESQQKDKTVQRPVDCVEGLGHDDRQPVSNTAAGYPEVRTADMGVASPDPGSAGGQFSVGSRHRQLGAVAGDDLAVGADDLDGGYLAFGETSLGRR
jgi:hypothetical protein